MSSGSEKGRGCWLAVPPERLKEAASQLLEKAEVIVAKQGVREQCETSARLQDVGAILHSSGLNLPCIPFLSYPCVYITNRYR